MCALLTCEFIRSGAALQEASSSHVVYVLQVGKSCLLVAMQKYQWACAMCLCEAGGQQLMMLKDECGVDAFVASRQIPGVPQKILDCLAQPKVKFRTTYSTPQ
jgi:hypothetical protein